MPCSGSSLPNLVFIFNLCCIQSLTIKTKSHQCWKVFNIVIYWKLVRINQSRSERELILIASALDFGSCVLNPGCLLSLSNSLIQINPPLRLSWPSIIHQHSHWAQCQASTSVQQLWSFPLQLLALPVRHDLWITGCNSTTLTLIRCVSESWRMTKRLLKRNQ